MGERNLRFTIQRNAICKLKQLVEALDSSYNEEFYQCSSDSKLAENCKYYALRPETNINPCSETVSERVFQRSHKKPPIPLKVTVDGRLVCQNQYPRLGKYGRPKEEIIPNRPPPSYRPRYASIELRGGVHYNGCDCVKRNGLQDDCPRWDCSGRPECDESPYPKCYPQGTTEFFGVRKPNFQVCTEIPLK